MSVTFKKARAATESFGRGRDARRTPAIRSVVLDGTTIGFISGDPCGFMEAPRWRVRDRRFNNVMTARSLKDAKAWVIANLAKLQEQTGPAVEVA